MTNKTRKNVLLIVVDQWRGDTLPMLGHPVHVFATVEKAKNFT